MRDLELTAGHCYLALFQQEFRDEAMTSLGVYPSALRLRFYADATNYSHMSSERFRLSMGSPLSFELNKKFLVHVTVATDNTSLLRARDVLNLLPDHCVLGADEPSPVAGLVMATMPTNAPRAFHSVLLEILPEHLTTTSMRTLHTTPSLVEMASQYSRAWWTNCRLEFVPTVRSSGLVMSITACYSGTESPPGDFNSMLSHGTCEHFIGGGAESCAPIFIMPIEFDRAHTNPLIKPAPQEMQRTAVSFRVDLADTYGTPETKRTGTLLRVILRGTVVFGGAN